MLTRRTATVTISAPDAAWAWAITGNDEYLPVPTMSREVKVRSAMTRGSFTGCYPDSGQTCDAPPPTKLTISTSSFSLTSV